MSSPVLRGKVFREKGLVKVFIEKRQGLFTIKDISAIIFDFTLSIHITIELALL